MKLLLVLLLASICWGGVGCVRPAPSADRPPLVPRKEVFILPVGYSGPFVAVYGQAQGSEPSWRADTAFHRVPGNGVLRVRYAEPPNSTVTSHVFANRPTRMLQNYPNCATMRVHVSDPAPRVCWLGYAVGGTGIPDHIVAVVTSWAEIPSNFNRTAFVYDSVLFQGKGKVIVKWEEPAEIRLRQKQTTQ